MGEDALLELKVAPSSVTASCPTRQQLKEISQNDSFQKALFKAGQGYDRVLNGELLEDPAHMLQAAKAAVSTAASGGGFASEMLEVAPGTVALPGLVMGSMQPHPEPVLPEDAQAARDMARALHAYYRKAAQLLNDPECSPDTAVAKALEAAAAGVAAASEEEEEETWEAVPVVEDEDDEELEGTEALEGFEELEGEGEEEEDEEWTTDDEEEDESDDDDSDADDDGSESDGDGSESDGDGSASEGEEPEEEEGDEEDSESDDNWESDDDSASELEDDDDGE